MVTRRATCREKSLSGAAAGRAAVWSAAELGVKQRRARLCGWNASRRFCAPLYQGHIFLFAGTVVLLSLARFRAALCRSRTFELPTWFTTERGAGYLLAQLLNSASLADRVRTAPVPVYLRTEREARPAGGCRGAPRVARLDVERRSGP